MFFGRIDPARGDEHAKGVGQIAERRREDVVAADVGRPHPCGTAKHQALVRRSERTPVQGVLIQLQPPALPETLDDERQT